MTVIRVPPRPAWVFGENTPDGRPLLRLVGDQYLRVGVITDHDAVAALSQLFVRAPRRAKDA